jgi:hypothetical protein
MTKRTVHHHTAVKFLKPVHPKLPKMPHVHTRKGTAHLRSPRPRGY